MALWESTSRSIVVWHIVWGYCSLAQWHGSPVRATGTTPQPPPPHTRRTGFGEGDGEGTLRWRACGFSNAEELANAGK